jgi:hypothetical protein
MIENINNITTLEEYSMYCKNMQQQIVKSGLPDYSFLPELIEKRNLLESHLLPETRQPTKINLVGTKTFTKNYTKCV